MIRSPLGKHERLQNRVEEAEKRLAAMEFRHELALRGFLALVRDMAEAQGTTDGRVDKIEMDVSCLESRANVVEEDLSTVWNAVI